MKYFLSIPCLIIILTGCQPQTASTDVSLPEPSNQETKEVAVPEKTMSQLILSSPEFENDAPMPAKFTCDGEDVSPLLKIAGVPEDAKSLVLIVDDPDAPLGDWVHWLIWNIDPSTREISENLAPAGALQGTTDFGTNKWGGPCPPSGEHRYQFKLYALDIMLELDSSATKKAIESAMQGHILDQTVLVGRYSRK